MASLMAWSMLSPLNQLMRMPTEILISDGSPNLAPSYGESADTAAVSTGELLVPDGTRLSVWDWESRPRSERRVHHRFTAEECRWLARVRLKYGPDVRLLDLSATGIQIESTRRLMPHARVPFELAGPDSRILVPSRVVRSSVELVAGSAVYRCGCAFDRPIVVPDDFLGSSRSHTSDLTHPAVRAEATFQRVVARYRNGRLLRGYTNDFSANRPHLHLRFHPTSGEAVFVPIVQLKALFFVRDFAGDPTHDDGKHFAKAPAGRKIEITFRDGEVLVGSTLNFRPDGAGFFVHPADPRSNNLRVFVTHAAIRHIRFD